MNELRTLIEDIQHAVFDYQIKHLSELIIQLVEKLMLQANQLTGEKQASLNQVLNAILASYEKKDYLLLADLLEYELKPILTAN